MEADLLCVVKNGQKRHTIGYNIKTRWTVYHQEYENGLYDDAEQTWLRMLLYIHHESSCLCGQLCFAASQQLTSVSCCCRLHAWFNHNQLTIIIKRLSKQTWAWVAECCIMDTGRVFTLTHRVLRCESLRFIAHGCRSQFSLQGPFVLFHYQLTQRKHWLGIAWAQDVHISLLF